MTAVSVNPSRDFRKDINGLRAWAVVAVVLYHFGVPGVRGGFIGVDVFFVISGFLMTGLVIKRLDQSGSGKRFALLNFYLARARRIVPALAVLNMERQRLAKEATPEALRQLKQLEKDAAHLKSALDYLQPVNTGRVKPGPIARFMQGFLNRHSGVGRRERLTSLTLSRCRKYRTHWTQSKRNVRNE